MRLGWFLLAGLLAAAACNNGSLLAEKGEPPPPPSPGPSGTGSPSASATPSPSPWWTFTPTPPPTPFPTPVPCGFYLIEQDGNLWSLDPASASATLIGPTGYSGLTDITITHSLDMIVISPSGALRVDPTSAQTADYADFAWVNGQNSLDALGDGRLLVGGGSELLAVDPASGATQGFPLLPGSYSFSGDVYARPDGIAFGTAVDPFDGPDHLMRIDLASGSITDLGSLGQQHVYGLDGACDGKVYGVTEGVPGQSIKPRVLLVDVTAATATVIGDLVGPVQVWGATGPAP